MYTTALLQLVNPLMWIGLGLFFVTGWLIGWLGLPLPGLGLAPSGGLTTNSRRTGDDATTALDLLTAVDGPLVRVTADAASDTVARLRDRRGAGCDGCRPTGQDGERLWPRPAVARAGPDDHVGEAARTAPLEEGVRVPSSEPGGEYVLPLQVHHRRWPSRPESSWAGE